MFFCSERGIFIRSEVVLIMLWVIAQETATSVISSSSAACQGSLEIDVYPLQCPCFPNWSAKWVQEKSIHGDCAESQTIFSNNRGLNPRNQKDYFGATTLGTKSQTLRLEVSLDTLYLVLFASLYCSHCKAAVNNVPVASDMMWLLEIDSCRIRGAVTVPDSWDSSE